MNIIDKIINYFDPETAYKRMQWRNAASAYDAGSGNRLNENWQPLKGTAESLNSTSRDAILWRARDLERNSDIAEAIISNFERNIIGTGIQLQAKITDLNGEDLEELNEKIEKLWRNWTKKKNCDITGRQSFLELQKMAIRRCIVDGGILFIKVYTKEGFKLQAREVDDLDSSKNMPKNKSGVSIVNGIELDQYNKAIAYHLKSSDSGMSNKSERIEASRVIYLNDIKRPSQIREISKLAVIANRVKDINQFLEANSVKEKILACLSVFIMRNTPGGLGRNSVKSDPSGYDNISIAPGMINQLQPGDDIKIVNPSGQASNAKEHVMINQRAAGSGVGLSYESSSRDMSQVNYSSARQGLLEDRKTYQQWHEFLISNFNVEVYEEFVNYCVLKNLIPEMSNFAANKERYLEHEWITPGFSWIDPLKEVNANRIALETGQTTLSTICNSAGLDWRDQLKQLKKEKDFAEELGLTIKTDTQVIINEDKSQ